MKDLTATGLPLPNAPDLPEPQGLSLVAPSAEDIKVGDRVVYKGEGEWVVEWSGVVTEILPDGIMVHWHADWPTIPVPLLRKFFGNLTFHPGGPVAGARVWHRQDERITGRITGVSSNGYTVETTSGTSVTFINPMPFDLAWVLSWDDE